LFSSITKAQLLVLDDWGPDHLTVTQRRDLMEIVEEQYGRGSTMITSELPIKTWHDVIGEPTRVLVRKVILMPFERRCQTRL
jgi:DNA replication protein DnaC